MNSEEVNKTKTINIDLLDLNRQNFNYGYLSKFNDAHRNIRLYTAFRCMFIIDQLHDFLEIEQRNNLLKKINSNDKSTNIEKQIKIYKNIISSFIEGIKHCINHFDSETTLESIIKNDYIKIKSVFFATDTLNFFQLIFKYFSISEKTLELDIDTKKTKNTDNIKYNLPLILKGNNKYIILDEILLRVFSIQHVNLDELFEANNSPYNCSENIEYINQLTKINYDNRYYPEQIDIDDKNIIVTVDADKSKYGLSELTRQVCSLKGNSINFVKTFATKFDSASSSTTESLLKLIYNRNKKQKFKFDDTINITDLTQDTKINSLTYVLTIANYKLIEFTYTLKHSNDIQIPLKFIEFINNPINDGEQINKLYEELELNKEFQVDKKISYIKKIFTNVRRFLKEYTFPDETKIFNEPGSLILSSFMSESPYNIDGFDVKMTKNGLSPLKLYTLFSGLKAIYVTINDKITIEEYCEQIFPNYMKIVKLDIDKFFEINRPNINIDNIKISTMLVDSIKNKVLTEESKKLIRDDIKNNKIKIYTDFFKNIESKLIVMLNKSDVELKKYGREIYNEFDISTSSIDFNLNNENISHISKVLNSISTIIDNIEETNVNETYFKIYNNLFGNYIFDFNQTNSSVASLTTNIIYNYSDKLDESKEILYIFAHKTLGDFGQVVSFYSTNTPTNTTSNSLINAGFGSEKRKKEDISESMVKRTKARNIAIEKKKNDLENFKEKMKMLKLTDCEIITEENIEKKYDDAMNRNIIIPTEKLKFFITFDRICSRISSIFNHGTIFESAGMTLSPLETFVNYCMLIESSIITDAELLRSLKRQR